METVIAVEDDMEKTYIPSEEVKSMVVRLQRSGAASAALNCWPQRRCFLPCFVSVNSPYIALMRCLRQLLICHSTLLTHTSVFCAFAKKQDATKRSFERRTYRCITPVTTARALMWCV